MATLDLPIAELSEAVRTGKLAAREVAESALERMREKSNLNAFNHVSEGPLLAAAVRLVS